MKELTELKARQYQSTIELSDLARQRYLDAGGDRRRAEERGSKVNTYPTPYTLYPKKGFIAKGVPGNWGLVRKNRDLSRLAFWTKYSRPTMV